MSENTMESTGFRSKPALRGYHFGAHFWGPEWDISEPPDFGLFRNLIKIDYNSSLQNKAELKLCLRSDFDRSVSFI